MIRNYFKIAWRNLLKNRAYSALNIVGLSVGMAVALLIGLWVFNEYSYDRFLPDADQLYQVKVNFTSQHDGKHTQNALALPLAEVLKKEYPEIKYVAQSDWNGTHGLMVGTKKLYLDGSAVGSDFLKMFQFPLIKGNANTVLKDTYSIVLTQSTAKALFGNKEPIGQLVKIDNQTNMKVTGVIKDLPAHSSFRFSYLFPFSFTETQEGWGNTSTDWGKNSFQLYAMLQPGVRYEKIAPKIKWIIRDKAPMMSPLKPEVIMQPIKDWHLYSDYKNGVPVGGFIDYVRLFSIIGVLVLLIACINFMNLSTARSEKRAREVGVRKAMGSKRSDLILQFLTESVLITFISFVLAIVLIQLALPAFNELTGESITVPYNIPAFWLAMFGYIILTGLLAGSRPAFYLSSFNTIKVLKGAIQAGKAATLPRKILVVVQFSCSVTLIISTVIIYQQIQHAKDRPSGYDTNRLVMSDMSDDLNGNYDALKNELMQTGLIEDVARASSPVTDIYSHTTVLNWPQKSATDETINIGTVRVSDNYFKTVGMKILQGHDFSTSWQRDTGSVLVNEAAVARMGLKNPINQEIGWNGGADKVKIIGVVQNALMVSPFTPVEPAIFSHGRRGNQTLYRLTANADTHTAIEKIEKIFDKYNPAYPFTYHFADDAYNQKFNLEVLVGKLAGVFAALAILISCLGLFGLVAYVAEQRTKEIGIRKVLGASIGQVWLLLSTDFIVLVFISCLIASPIAYYFIYNWLLKYEYRVTITPFVFILSGAAAILITLFTVSFQSVKAALANPVKSLRSE
ncbi:ABC transporter permease [Mucilaginibacter sp. UR6-11]|uniref:ABC transporter permease n=1 Tax=Mucilaginibacter sp. UR6-11 TaxID=1435644 RepID=UPI001E452C35|nr:ABC transporter permease [Mucilaginibacter sp. UR6-11]MCC8424891.1 ABC transporter permease [Mucilaginibacter sp. UR6-11]